VDSGLGDRERSRATSEHGFTLIEVLMAALITLIISAGVATALVSSTDYTSYARGQSNAQAVAEQDQERMKAMSDAQLTSLHQTRTVTLAGSQWTVTSSSAFLNATGGSSCTSTSTAYFKLTSTVTAGVPSGGTATLANVETIIARPLAGSLVVPVDTQTGGPLSGVGITVVGQTTNYTASATTDVNGCVAFAGLPTDSYTITASDPGYVSPNGSLTPSETASVTQSGVTAATAFAMGLEGNLRVGFRTVGSSGTVYSGGTGPQGYETSYYGSGNGLQMTNADCTLASGSCASATPYSAPVGSGSTTTTLGSLFPFWLNSTSQYTNNYQVWAGGCPQEQPLQPPSGTDFGTVNPGQALPTGSATDVTVEEPAIDVAIKSGSSTALPTHVTVTFTGDNSSGSASCTDVWHQIASVGSESVSGTTYAIYPAPFASTAAAGNTLASNDGLKGTITVCADNGSKYGTSAALTNTNFTGATVVPVINPTTSGTC
jgi:prepilin-type N-terminal cleavage/methylation domain-containing protein